MNAQRRRSASLVPACMLALVALIGQASVSAQDSPRGGRRGTPPSDAAGAPPAGVSPAEIQRLFDAYVVMQAQQELQLTDEQYPQFLSRVKALQDVRRRSATERVRILAGLRRLTDASKTGDEAQISSQLKALDDLEARATTDARQALDALNQVLDVRQQARFRLFEERMERRKVELLMQARQGRAPRGAGRP